MVVASAVAAAGMFGFSAVSASAATVGSVTGSSVNPDSSCTESAAWAVLTGPGGEWFGICGGTGIFPTPSGFQPFTDLTVRRTNRVWLHQTYPAKGWADCFSVPNPPKTFALSGRDKTPGDLQVSANTAGC